MFEILIYGIIWCFAIYGILVMIKEFVNDFTYKKDINGINLILTVKNAQNVIENYIREELALGYKNIVVIDLESDDETMCILKELEKDNLNLKVLNKTDGENYLKSQVS